MAEIYEKRRRRLIFLGIVIVICGLLIADFARRTTFLTGNQLNQQFVTFLNDNGQLVLRVQSGALEWNTGSTWREMTVYGCKDGSVYLYDDIDSATLGRLRASPSSKYQDWSVAFSQTPDGHWIRSFGTPAFSDLMNKFDPATARVDRWLTLRILAYDAWWRGCPPRTFAQEHLPWLVPLAYPFIAPQMLVVPLLMIPPIRFLLAWHLVTLIGLVLTVPSVAGALRDFWGI